MKIGGDGKMGLPTDMIPPRERKPARSCHYRCKGVYPDVISQVDVLGTDNQTVLGDLDVFSHRSKPESTQFVGSEKSDIKRVADAVVQGAYSAAKRPTQLDTAYLSKMK